MSKRAAAPSGTAIAPVLLGVVLGASAQLQQPGLWPLAVYLAGALLALSCLLLVLRLRPGSARGVALLVTSTVLWFALTGWRAASYTETALAPAIEGRDLLVTGLVAAMPHRNEGGLRFRFEPESARLGDSAVVVPPALLLGWYVDEGRPGAGPGAQRQPADLRPGERWQLAVRLKAPHGNVNPHGFDYELWLWEQGLQATGYVRAGPRDPPPRRLAVTWAKPVEQARHAVRDAIYAQVPDPRLAGVIAALVVGDQGAIERADWDVYRATGVAHLMSISGLHITMFAWAAGALVGLLWRRSVRLCLAWPAQHAARVGGVLLATAYAVFSGWGVPSQRTVLMLAVVGLLRLGAREWPWPWVWLLACATVVAVDPWALTQAGFWLSFVAVGVLFASGPAHAPAAAGEERRWPQRLRAAVGAMLREQGIVTLALTPLTLLLFNQVSLVGLLANLLAIPWVTLVVTPLGLAGVLFGPAWTLAAAAVQGLALFLGWLAALPFATWSAPAPPLWAAAAGMVGGLLLAMRLPWTVRALGVPLLLPVLLWQAPRPPPGEFELLAADIGQGNAVLVRTATHALVYDAGPGYSRETDAGQRVLVPLLRALDESIDLLVLSHRDSDHTGGAAAVLGMQRQARLLSSLEAGHPLQTLRPSERCVAGQSWEWDGVRFEVLHPQAADYERPAKPNALSCVLRIANAHARVLLVGDIEKAQEATLAASPERLRADLLLVPHHGSRTSSTAAFLDAVRPSQALVQAGYRNRFGHPAPDVVARYLARGIAVTASPACGAAAWDSRVPALVRCERKVEPRYWHHLAAPDYKLGA
ncbi:DNA internalization-related competence protein ComEC/Rec2 [Ramlibacter sp.]|uniref:DNA internalization-related competence protein ComEC/Rec2 n=1 Tax=Ramlibacter sp. TaxID=1917967 RepID=UPI002612C263|nr:DNA internalization-related competence protein ComEC/Rec2 [Ramlibacter sp.]MDB5956149.1 internalization-related competence protein ComEC/Rec2 [Ramlibacter sp.]